jgi:RNA polymerase primary sigma factor
MENVHRIYWFIQKFSKENGRDPTTEESISKVELELNVKREKAQELLEVAQRLETLSLDHHSFSASFSASLPSPDERMHTEELREQIEMLLAELSVEEEYILRQRFGIGEVRAHTLKEIGATLDVTHECVRQIESKTLKKLRKKKGTVLQTLL